VSRGTAATRGGRPSGHAFAPALLVAALAFAAFIPALGNGFVNLDDPILVTTQVERMRGPLGEVVRWALTETGGVNWFPLTRLSHAVDARLFGLDPRGHHLSSLLLHAANAALLFLFLRGATGAAGRSLLVASLFAVHPLQAESVAWVAERSNLLATQLWILALMAHVRYARAPSPDRYLVVAGLFLLGLAAKPTVVALPLTLLALDVWPLGRLPLGGPGAARAARLPLLEKLPLLAAAAAHAAFVFRLQAAGGAVRTLETFPLAMRLRAMPSNVAIFLRKAVAPFDLHPYQLHPRDGLPWAATLAALALLGFATWAAARGRRRRPFLAAGWLWFAAILLPVSGIVQAGLGAPAERFAYLALVGPWWMLAWSLPPPRRRGARRAAAAAAAALLLALGTLAQRQARFWRDTVTLDRHALASDPANYLARGNLMALHFDTGDYDAALDEALVLAAQHPDWAGPRRSVGRALDLRGDLEGAIHHLREAVRIDPGDRPSREGLERLLARRDALAAEMERRRKGIEGQTASAADLRDLGSALADAGRMPEAVDALREAVALDPALPDARRILAALEAWRPHLGEARVRYRELAAGAAESAEPLVTLARTLASAGEQAEALEVAGEALRRDPASAAALRDVGLVPRADAFGATVR